MCEPRRGGSIYKECRDILFAMNGTERMTNRKMRRIIAEHGGCMAAKPQKIEVPLDRLKIPVLTS